MDAVGRVMDVLRFRKRAYQMTFDNSPAPQDVLIDLARFCRASETCVVMGDPTRTAVLEGRREVWLRIANHLNLTSQQLYALYQGQQFNPTIEDQETAI